MQNPILFVSTENLIFGYFDELGIKFPKEDRTVYQ